MKEGLAGSWALQERGRALQVEKLRVQRPTGARHLGAVRSSCHWGRGRGEGRSRERPGR